MNETTATLIIAPLAIFLARAVWKDRKMAREAARFDREYDRQFKEAGARMVGDNDG